MNRIPPFRDALFFVFIFALVSFSSFAQNDKELTPLVTDEIIEREIGGVYTKHTFQLNLSARQFVKIEAEQTGCDVIFALYSPEGFNLFDVNNSTVEGIESAIVAVEKAGEYELQVVSFSEKKGSYKLKIAELRPATEKEIALTCGIAINNNTFNKATNSATTDVILKSIEQYEQALEKFRFAGDLSFEGHTLNQIGGIYYKLGNQTKAFEYFNKGLNTSRLTGDKFQISANAANLGMTYLVAGDSEKALELLFESLQLRREIKNVRAEAQILDRIGTVFYAADDLNRAESYFQEALKLLENLQIYPNLESDELNNLGKVAFARNDFQKARLLFQKALSLAQQPKNKRRKANSLGNLGKVSLAFGDSAQAIQFLTDSQTIYRSLNDKVGEASILKILGKAYFTSGDNEKSLESLNQALQIYRSIEDPNNLAETLFALAATKSRLGKLDEAQTHLEEALQIIEGFRAKINVNELRDSFSIRLYEYYNAYTELLMERHFAEPNKNFAELAWQATERGRARNLLNLLNEANAEIEQGVEPKLLERERELSGLLNVRLENLTRFLSGKHDIQKVETLKKEIEKIRIEYQILQGQIREQSPRYAALKQPQTLDLKEVQTQILDNDSVLLSYSLGTEKSYLWLITKDNFQVFNLPKREEIESKARNFYNLLTARNKKIKFETPAEKDLRIARADEDFPKSAQELSQILLGLIENQIGSKRLLIVADGALQYIPFASLTSPKSKVQSPKSEPPALAGGLNAAKNPSQLKARNPETENRFLIETNEIVNLPSISALAILRREKLAGKIAPKTIAVLADPVFETNDERFSSINKKTKNLGNVATTRLINTDNLSRSIRDSGDSGEESAIPRLPFTRREAEAVSALVPKNQRKISLDFSATRQTILSGEMNQYRIIHLATHGFINSKNPELSGLVFSLIDENGTPQNGFLRTDEIFNLKLSADLVVLSGCKTGLGKEIRGEGLIGMTRGFMYAGASRLVVSLWDVNDESTAEYMQKFYQAMLGKEKLSPAAALRSAQITMLKNKRWQNPYFWSTFVIQGEPR